MLNGTLFFSNKDTGAEFSLGEVHSLNIVTESRAEVDYLYNPNPPLVSNCTRESTMTLNMDKNGMESFVNFIGLDLTNCPSTYCLSFHLPVQVRKHRKRRINKKWAKRYGYRFVLINCDDWRIIKNDLETGEVEFRKEVRV